MIAEYWRHLYFFVVRPFLLTSLLIYIYFPTSNKMAIIGTLPPDSVTTINNFRKAPCYVHAHKNYLYFRPR